MKRISVSLVSVLAIALPVTLGTVLESGGSNSVAAANSAAPQDLGWG